MKIKEITKVIANNKVYVKMSDILQLEELKVAGYKKTKAKEILIPYTTKLKGLGNGLWLLEEDLESVGLIQKTITYEVFSDIKDSISASNFGLSLAALSFKDRISEEWLEKEREKIVHEAIVKQESKETIIIESIEDVLEKIKDIEQLNKKLTDYNAEVTYEIKKGWKEFKLNCRLVAPNCLRDIYLFGKDSRVSKYFEFIDNNTFSFWDDNAEGEIILSKEGEIVYDTNKSFIENELELTEDKSRIKLECQDAEWINVYSRENSGLNIDISMEMDDIITLLEGKAIITFNKEQLLDIKDKLLVCKDQNIECVNKIKSKL